MSQVELKTHYSAAELASMKLPGLPGTQQNVKARAKKEEWESRPRAGFGGGHEYAITSLPLEAINAIKTRAAAGARINQLMDPKAATAPVVNSKEHPDRPAGCRCPPRVRPGRVVAAAQPDR